MMSKKREKPKKETITLPDSVITQNEVESIFKSLDRAYYDTDSDKILNDDIYVDVVYFENLSCPKTILLMKAGTNYSCKSIINTLLHLFGPWWECVFVTGYPSRYLEAHSGDKVLMYPRVTTNGPIPEYGDTYRALKSNGYVFITRDSLYKLLTKLGVSTEV
jgi:hypothetical protein